MTCDICNRTLNEVGMILTIFGKRYCKECNEKSLGGIIK